MRLTVTDKITDIYPQAKIASPVVQPEAGQAKQVAQAEQQAKPVADAPAPEAKAALPMQFLPHRERGKDMLTQV